MSHTCFWIQPIRASRKTLTYDPTASRWLQVTFGSFPLELGTEDLVKLEVLEGVYNNDPNIFSVLIEAIEETGIQRLELE